MITHRHYRIHNQPHSWRLIISKLKAVTDVGKNNKLLLFWSSIDQLIVTITITLNSSVYNDKKLCVETREFALWKTTYHRPNSNKCDVIAAHRAINRYVFTTNQVLYRSGGSWPKTPSKIGQIFEKCDRPRVETILRIIVIIVINHYDHVYLSEKMTITTQVKRHNSEQDN